MGGGRRGESPIVKVKICLLTTVMYPRAKNTQMRFSETKENIRLLTTATYCKAKLLE